MTLDEARNNIGKPVIYQDRDDGPLEEGMITGVSARYVFVRYRGQHPTADGRATPADRLMLP